jgi:hypothetical protein
MVAANLPPGPKGHFLLGNIPDYRRGQLEFLERCTREYGDIVRLRLGYHRIFLVNHPEAIEEVLVTKSRNFIKHFALRLTPALLGNGLLFSEGDFYLRQRRMVQPSFNLVRRAEQENAMGSRFLRSEHPERVGKSPAELLSGQSHPHWLQMLGFTLFCRPRPRPSPSPRTRPCWSVQSPLSCDSVFIHILFGKFARWIQCIHHRRGKR